MLKKLLLICVFFSLNLTMNANTVSHAEKEIYLLQ